jgi:hypothetical protein
MWTAECSPDLHKRLKDVFEVIHRDADASVSDNQVDTLLALSAAHAD